MPSGALRNVDGHEVCVTPDGVFRVVPLSALEEREPTRAATPEEQRLAGKYAPPLPAEMRDEIRLASWKRNRHKHAKTGPKSDFDDLDEY